MNGFVETGISLVLIFFIFSIINYIIQELIAVNLKCRSKVLWKPLSQLMDGFILKVRMKLIRALPAASSNTVNFDQLYSHVLIKSLQKNLDILPSFIPATSFALAIMDLLAQKATTQTGVLFNDFTSGLQNFNNSNGAIFKILQNILATSSMVYS